MTASGRGRLAVVLGTVLAASAAQAQPVRSRGAGYTVQRWSVGEGLPQSSVTGLAQTRDGYLWLTTFGGVVRFDGVTFDVYDLASHPALGSQRFVGVVEDGRGDLYFAAQDDDLVRLSDGVFTRLALPAEVKGRVNGVVVDGAGTVWVLIGASLVHVDGDRIEVESIAGDVSDMRINVDTKGAVWLAQASGVACWTGACERPRRWGLPTRPWLDTVAQSHSGGLWHRAWGAVEGCARFSDVRWTRVFRWGEQTWCARRQRLQTLDSSGVDIDLAVRAPWETHEMLGVYGMIEDREGSLWVGGAGGGLVRVRARHLLRIGSAHGLEAASVWSVASDAAGRIWVEQNGHVRVLVDDRVQTTPPAIIELEPVSALASDGAGNLWLATEAGTLHRYDGARLERLDAQLPPGEVAGLWPTGDGAMWIGIDAQGAFAWRDGGIAERYSEAELGGSVRVVRAGGRGDLWFGTSAGLAHLDDGRIELFGRDRGVAPGATRDVWIGPEGAVWAGSYGGGLTRIKDGVVRRVTRAQGLCDDVASRIIADDFGMLWMNGNRGVFRVSRADLRAVVEGARATLQCSLLESGEGNGNGGLRAADGRLWFPTTNGIVAISPAAYDEPTRPIAHLASFTLGGRAVREGEVFTSRQDDLEIQMTALSFVDPRALYFRYRLLGYDDDWVSAGTQRAARYTRLPPGEYRFEFRARSVSGVWSEPRARSFVIEPRFYERNRFYVACVLALVALSWGAATLRTRGTHRHNRALQAEIDEREKVTERLRAEEAHYRALFENTSDALFVHEADGPLIEVNPAGRSMVGLDRGELRSAAPLGHVATVSRDTYQALMSGQLSGPHEAQLIGRDGTPLEVRLQAARLDAGPSAQVLVSAVDLTAERVAERERRDLERQLRQSQKLEALGQLAGGIAHDFNNVLTAIGMENSLLRGADQDDAESIANIAAAVQRASALTKRLLVFGRHDATAAQLVNLHDRLRELMTVLRRTVPADIALNLEAPPTPLLVRVDPTRLEQVVINLVLNARDAITGSGAIDMRIEHRELDEVESARRACPPGQYAVVSVSDDGSGIDAAILDRLFEPFFTTKDVGKGSGLGLAIVHGAMREAGGFVNVESQPGHGSTFALHFPLAEGLVEEAVVADVPLIPGDGATVLLCDDEGAVRQVAARALRRGGYRVLEAATPEEALTLLSTERDQVEMLVTDVVMPQMSGAELARRALESTPNLPVLFISGHTRDVVLDRGVVGESELLTKPFSMESLVRRVGLMRQRRTPAPR